MANKVTNIVENDIRLFQTENKKQHDMWKDYVSGVIRMDADDRLKEVAATGYIEGQMSKFSDEIFKTLVKTYEKSYDMNYNFYVDKLGLNPKNKSTRSEFPEDLSRTLLSYDSKLSRETNEMFREYGRGQINSETLKTQLVSALSKNENALNSLFQNEAHRYAELSAIDSMNDVGVTQYIFVSVMDGKTSDMCSELNGKIFSVKDAEIGVNVPPLHPNCRSEIIPYDEMNYRQSKNEMSYDEWLAGYSKENYNIDYVTSGEAVDRPYKNLSDIELYNAYLKETEALAKLKSQYDAQGLQYESWMKLPGEAAEEMEARGIYVPAGKMPVRDEETANKDDGNKPSGPYYLNNEELVSQITTTDTKFNQEVSRFKKAYETNKSAYDKIAEEAGVPPELVAVLHYRENTSDFLNGTFGIYLHNGQALGKPTTAVPAEKNFDNFYDAAVDAFKDKNSIVDVLQLSSDSEDIVAILTFAEVFNGTGYSDNGRISPYLYSGTNIYSKGKYTSDGVYNPNIVDAQAGIYILLKAIM